TSVENSLGSLFGDDDDLPVENLNVQPKTEEKQEEPSEAKAEESLETSVENSLDSLFGEDDDLPVENLNVQPKTEENGLFEKSSSADVELAKTEEKADDSLENSVESSFDNLFGKNSDDELSLDDLKLEEAPAPENTPAEVKKETTLDNSVDSSFDHIFGKDSDDALLEDPTTSTRTLAEIYFGQGVYDEAIKIYKDLLRKNPEDAALKDRLAEIEKIRNDKTLN
ncbi:MAG: tetratricopeptide repeat protein, partial [Fibrobacter sp.]|nr:tetratricopeptide repeat protein [Fibrobacter sp.]MDY6369715.1 tetratricopeptide repeat protein [Fibrobacter sp.]MDY6391006.1 tetratricopeptide repeat protein [Fibrobacter sp.]